MLSPLSQVGVERAFRDASTEARMFRCVHAPVHPPVTAEAVLALLEEADSDAENDPYRAPPS